MDSYFLVYVFMRAAAGAEGEGNVHEELPFNRPKLLVSLHGAKGAANPVLRLEGLGPFNRLPSRMTLIRRQILG